MRHNLELKRIPLWIFRIWIHVPLIFLVGCLFFWPANPAVSHSSQLNSSPLVDILRPYLFSVCKFFLIFKLNEMVWVVGLAKPYTFGMVKTCLTAATILTIWFAISTNPDEVGTSKVTIWIICSSIFYLFSPSLITLVKSVYWALKENGPKPIFPKRKLNS